MMFGVKWHVMLRQEQIQMIFTQPLQCQCVINGALCLMEQWQEVLTEQLEEHKASSNKQVLKQQIQHQQCHLEQEIHSSASLMNLWIHLLISGLIKIVMIQVCAGKNVLLHHHLHHLFVSQTITVILLVKLCLMLTVNQMELWYAGKNALHHQSCLRCI